MKKKRPRLKKSPYLAIEHTRILTNSTTTLPQTKNTHHSEIYSLEFIFFLINFQIHYWFPASFLFYRNTEPQQMIQKNIHTKVKTRKTKLFGERIKTIYTLKVRLLHQNIPLYITMQFDCHFPFHRKTHYANQNKQTTTLQNLSTGNWKRHWMPLTTQIDPSLNNFLNTSETFVAKQFYLFWKEIDWLIYLQRTHKNRRTFECTSLY